MVSFAGVGGAPVSLLETRSPVMRVWLMGYAGRWFPRFEEQPASATIVGLELLIRYRRSDGMGSDGE